MPLVVDQDYQLQVLFRVFLFAALGLAWNLVGGYAGQLSLGHAAYFGVGAYGLALFHRQARRAGLARARARRSSLAVAAALVIGRIAFRLRGPYFALATIAFGEILRLTAEEPARASPAATSASQVPSLFTSDPSRWFYWSAVVLAAVAFAITALIVRSRFGYQLQADPRGRGHRDGVRHRPGAHQADRAR